MARIGDIEAQGLLLVEAQRFKAQGVRDLKSEIANAGLRKTGTLLKSVKGSVKILFGDVDRISFTSLRYGFIQNAGITSPYMIHSGQLMPARTGKNFISNALDEPTKELADFVASNNADSIVKFINFKTNSNE